MKKLICNDCEDGVGDCGECEVEVKPDELILCAEWGDSGHVHFACAVKSWVDNLATTKIEDDEEGA